MSDRTSAHVTVERPPDLGGLLTRLVVELDGTPVAKLRRGGSATIEVKPGRHVLRVRQAWFGSAPLALELGPDDRVILSAGTEERAVSFTATFLHPERALDLKLISTE